mgnify:CR=1 FL=1
MVEDKALEKELFGLTFKNPVGLAAGFDKDAKLYNELSNFGEVRNLSEKAEALLKHQKTNWNLAEDNFSALD